MPATKSPTHRRWRVLAMSVAITVLAAGGTTMSGLAAEAKNPDQYATWEDVIAAQGDVNRQNQLIADINSQLAQLETEVAAAETAAQEAAAVLADAKSASLEQYDTHLNLQVQADDAATTADAAERDAGAMAAAMADRVQIDPTIQLLTRPENAENFLQSMSMLSKIGTHNGAIYADAVNDRNNASQLAEQAAAELTEYERLADEATLAFNDASNAQMEVEAAKTAVIEKSAELQAMLIPLEEHRDVVAADYELAEQMKADAIAADQAQTYADQQARIDMSAAAADAAAAAQGGDGSTAATTWTPPKRPQPVYNPQLNPPTPNPTPSPTPTTDPTPPPVVTPEPTPTEDPADDLPTVEPTTEIPTIEPTAAPAPAPEPAPEPEPAPIPEPEPAPEPAPPAGPPGEETLENGAVLRHGVAAPITPNAVITDEYGMRLHPVYGTWRMHWGLDLAVPGGTCWAPLYAPYSGTVTYAGWWDGYGNVVEYRTDDGYTDLRYAHIVEGGINVSVGQYVTAGTLLAYAGTTGPSTGCHLHLEIMEGGENVDPLPWLAHRGFPYYW